jgi:D-threo-aldose 1-dehydrogenase
VLHLHDPDNHEDHLDQAKKGAIKAMIKLKEENVVKAIGCGLNQNEMLVELAKEGCFDCFLLAGRYTLLDQSSLDELIPVCISNDISIILGGVFNSGILINPGPETYFDYTKLDSDWYENAKKNFVRFPKEYESDQYWLNKAYKLRDVCNNYNISIKNAALKFPYGNKIIATSILGMRSINEVDENVENYNKNISSDFWNEIKSQGLIDQRSPLDF